MVVVLIDDIKLYHIQLH